MKHLQVSKQMVFMPVMFESFQMQEGESANSTEDADVWQQQLAHTCEAGFEGLLWPRRPKTRKMTRTRRKRRSLTVCIFACLAGSVTNTCLLWEEWDPDSSSTSQAAKRCKSVLQNLQACSAPVKVDQVSVFTRDVHTRQADGSPRQRRCVSAHAFVRSPRRS